MSMKGKTIPLHILMHDHHEQYERPVFHANHVCERFTENTRSHTPLVLSKQL